METPPLTYEHILELFRLSNEQFNQQLAQERAEREREREKREKEREQERAEREREREKREKEREKERAEREREREQERAAYAEREAKRDAANKELDRRLARVTDTLGRFAEGQVRPVALELFQNLNIPIYEETYNSVRKGPDKRFLYEVDILLYNTDFVVAIEVKTTLRKEDVDEHIERIKLMQDYPLKGIRGTKIIGAVAGMNVNEDVVNYGVKNGMYVIVPNGESVRVANEEGFKPWYWQIKA